MARCLVSDILVSLHLTSFLCYPVLFCTGRKNEQSSPIHPGQATVILQTSIPPVPP